MPTASRRSTATPRQGWKRRRRSGSRSSSRRCGAPPGTTASSVAATDRRSRHRYIRSFSVLEVDATGTFPSSMKRHLPAALLLAALAAVLFVGAQAGSAKPPVSAPKGFFGIGPQTSLTDRDLEYMKAGGIESIRWPLGWAGIQPTRKGGYHWESFDAVVAIAARQGLSVLPFFYGSPDWVAPKETTLPINGQARKAWTAFLAAAVK